MSIKVRERPKGSDIWWIYIDHSGKRKAKKIGHDKRLALEIAKKLEARLILGEFNISNDSKVKYQSFKEYAQNWLNTYIKQMRRVSTYERYRDALDKHVIPILGKIPINDIRRSDVRNFLLSLYEKGFSRSFIGIIFATISGPLSYAVDEEILSTNPIIGLTKRLEKTASDSKLVDFLAQDEVNLFLLTCNDYFHDYYPFFLTAFRTGMRLGELLGLKWSDIDWNNNFIEVKRSYKIGRFGPTKTGKNRRVDMSDQLVAVLKKHYLNNQKYTVENKLKDVIEIVFHREGKPIEQNFIRRIFKRILTKAGIREIRFHDIRHTYASLLLSNGESPVYVKDQLGHFSIQMTVDIYGHLIPGSNRQAVNRLDTQPSATYTQPEKRKVVQSAEIAPLSISLVPKPGFEPGQAYTH